MKARRKHRYEPDYAVPPGATLEATMHTLAMTQRDLATRTGLTVQSLNRIFNGEQPITPGTAQKLELVTGTPAAYGDDAGLVGWASCPPIFWRLPRLTLAVEVLHVLRKRRIAAL
jgi:transcriptional regulator with XRE-family HTH domain